MQIHLIETAGNFNKLRGKDLGVRLVETQEDKAKAHRRKYLFTKSAPSRLSTEGQSGVTGSSRRNPFWAGSYLNSNIIPPAGGSRPIKTAGR